MNSLRDNVLGELGGIPKKARVRGFEICNPLEHSRSCSSKLNVANKERQEEDLAEHTVLAIGAARCAYVVTH
jgi:hypothetical protein